MMTAFACAYPNHLGLGGSAPSPLSSVRDASISRSSVRRRVLGLLQAVHAPSHSVEAVVSDGSARFRTALHQNDDVASFDVAGHLERTFKATAYALDADLIGGGNVTRLERMIQSRHPRLSYRKVLSMLAGRGFGLEVGDDIPPEAAACLTYQCGLLPVLVVDCPGDLVTYLLPYAGETFRGCVTLLPSAAQADSTIHRLDVRADIERLVDYFLAAGRVSSEAD